MKVAFFSESPADEAAVRVFVEGLLEEEAVPPSPTLRLKRQGWQAVLRQVPVALRYLHYNTDADALVVTLDSDESPVPQKGHGRSGFCAEAKCRLCHVRRAIDETRRTLRSRQGRGPVLTAVGVAVPAIEAWCLVGKDRHVSESSWILGLKSRKLPYTKPQLKQMVYGSDRQSLEIKTRRGAEEARRIVANGKLSELEQLFPGGFGALASDIRGWLATSE